MGFFSRKGKVQRGGQGRLSDLDRCRSEEEALSAIPLLVQGVIETVQKESIRFYRRVHSHDMGSYRAVRDEFFFLLLAVVRWRIEDLLSGEQASPAIALLRKEMSNALAGVDRAFDPERFWNTWDDRCQEYRYVLLPEQKAEPDLVADALAPCFGRHLTGHLDEQAVKVMHFSAHSLRDLLRAT
jgi:hypothetical protein